VDIAVRMVGGTLRDAIEGRLWMKYRTSGRRGTGRRP
jgi:hypothetical protein